MKDVKDEEKTFFELNVYFDHQTKLMFNLDYENEAITMITTMMMTTKYFVTYFVIYSHS